jgi:hypothetical protein
MARHRERLVPAPDTALDPESDDAGSDDLPTPAPVAQPGERTDRIAHRTWQRYAEFHALLAKGLEVRAICAWLTVARETVRRFARASYKWRNCWCTMELGGAAAYDGDLAHARVRQRARRPRDHV